MGFIEVGRKIYLIVSYYRTDIRLRCTTITQTNKIKKKKYIQIIYYIKCYIRT